MDNDLQTEVITKVEAVLTSLDAHYFVLQLTNIKKPLLWPRASVADDLKVGDHFVVELKNSHVQSIQKIVEEAKKNSQNQQIEEMHRLLESLIN